MGGPMVRGILQEDGSTGQRAEGGRLQSVRSVSGVCPAAYPIKAKRTSWGEAIYHVPEGAFYHRALAYECFATEEDAQSAGYRRSER